MSQKTKLGYLAATASLSYMIADIIHEVIGHGGMCALLGNQITLLTSVYFKSNPGSLLIDLGGPISNLIFGSLFFMLLNRTRKASLFLFQVSAYNLFWFSGTMLHSAVSKTGDWTFASREIIAPPFHIIALLLSGALCYILAFRVLSTYVAKAPEHNQHNPLTKHDIIVSFMFASLAATTAGLFFAPDRLHAAMEGLLEMVAPFPILFLRFQKNTSPEAAPTKPNNLLPWVACIVYIIFCLTLGRGLS